MLIKFSLSGSPWIIGSEADSIYAKVVDAEIPASLITTMWSDKDMAGSISISLAQISCRFDFIDVPADDLIAILKTFMHEDYVPEEISNSLYLEMLEVKNNSHDSDEENNF